MRLEFFGDPSEKAVVSEIFSWTEKVLSKENSFFNGLPPCPYAERAVKDNRVAILFKYEESYQPVYSTISRYDDAFDVVIIVDMDNKKAPEDFHEYLDQMNTAISDGVFIDRDVWVMGFHPLDEASEFTEKVDFEPMTDTEYALIFVQRLTKLQESAYKLKSSGYYDCYGGKYDAEGVYERREDLYRRLKNGHVA